MALFAQRVKPRIILGLMTFGPDPSAGARITSLTDYNACLDHFQSQGYSEIDTARVYVGTKQEAFTREAQWQSRGLTLATKLYPTHASHTPANLREQVDISLKELGATCVDIFYLHAPDRNVPFAETLEACDKLHKEGKFVQLGLSNFTAFEVAEIVMTCKYNNWVRPTIYQGMYNAITRTLQTELIPACRRYGLDVVVYNPIAGGLFSGKYNFDELVADANKPPTEGRFSDSVGRMGPMYRERYFRPETFKALKIVEEASKKAGITLVETALRWCLHHSALRVGGIEYENGEKGNDGLVIGVSSLEQLEMNLKAVEEGKLPESVVKALDDAWAVARGGNLPNYWHLELKYGYDTRKELFGV